jgi:DNA-binding FadR family transcriptional regulator
MQHAADRVFDGLAAAILRGELPAGSSLPAERVLAQRFDTSRILVRQAVHRLASLGLVQVSQGESSRVLDPDQATDLGVLALFYRLAPGEMGLSAADMMEKQYLQGLSMVSVASRRAAPEALRRLALLVTAYQTGVEKSGSIAELEERYWRALSRAGGNRIFVMEVAWWYQVLSDRPLPPSVRAASRRIRLAFYGELTRRLVERDHPVEYYLAATSAILDGLFPRR